MFGAEFVRMKLPEAGIAVLTMQREEGPNVVSAAFCEQLLRCCETLAVNDTLRAVVLRAEGHTFCVGADVFAMTLHSHDLPGHVAALADSAHAAMLALKRLPVLAGRRTAGSTRRRGKLRAAPPFPASPP